MVKCKIIGFFFLLEFFYKIKQHILLSYLMIFVSQTLVTFFNKDQLNSLALRQTNVRLVARANDEDIGQTGSEYMTLSIRNMHNIEGAGMSFTVDNGTDTTQISTSSDHAQVAGIELDVIGDFASGNINLYGIVSLDQGIGVTDGATVMGNNEWYTLGAQLCLADLAQFVGSFFSGDAVNGETTFNIVDQTEVFTGLFDGDDIHETSWVGGVGAYFTIDLNQTLHNNFSYFSTVQGVLQTISQENHHGQRFTQFVWTGGGTGSENTSQFVQHPSLRGG